MKKVLVLESGKQKSIRTESISSLNQISYSEIRALNEDFVRNQKEFILRDSNRGGLLYFDENSLDADNDGTCFVTNWGGRIKRRYDGIVCAKWFGASPDNPDNGIAINKAINSLQNGDGEVQLPRGVLNVRTSIVLYQGTCLIGHKSHYTVNVLKNGTTLRLGDNANTDIIVSFLNGTLTPVDNSSHSIRVTKLRFDGNKLNNVTGNALYLTSLGETSIIENLRIVDFPESGIKLEGHHVPGCIKNVNILGCNSYAVNASGASGQLWLDGISVDDCALGVFRINGHSRGILTVTINNIKHEKRALSGNVPLVFLDNAIRSGINIKNVSSYNFSNLDSECVDIIRINGLSNEQPYIQMSNISNFAGKHNLVKDNINVFTKALSAGITEINSEYFMGYMISHNLPINLYNTVKKGSLEFGMYANSTLGGLKNLYDGVIKSQWLNTSGGTQYFDGSRFFFRDAIDGGNFLFKVDKDTGIEANGVNVGNVLATKMTKSARLAIPIPRVGEQVYQLTGSGIEAEEGLYIYKSTGWTKIA